MHVPTRRITEAEIAKMVESVLSDEEGHPLLESAFDEVGDDESLLDATPDPLEQLSRDLTTLSLVPKGRWQTLLHLDVIKVRLRSSELAIADAGGSATQQTARAAKGTREGTILLAVVGIRESARDGLWI